MISSFMLLLFTWISILAAVVYCVTFWYFNGLKRRRGEAPLITGWIPFVGVALKLGSNPMQYLWQVQKKYGDVFTLVVMGRRMTFMMNPHDFPKVYSASKVLNSSPIAQRIVKTVFGARIDLMQDEHLDKEFNRQFVVYLQGKDALNDLTVNMQKRLEMYLFEDRDQLSQWQSSGLYAFITKLIFYASVHALFGDGLSSEQILQDFKKFDDKFHIMMSGVPMKFLPESVKARERIVKLLSMDRENESTFVKARKELLHSICEDVDDASRLDYTIFWAAQANTIPATFWAVACLLKQNDAVIQEISQELDHVISNVEPCSGLHLPVLLPDQLDKMVKLDSIINESMRMSSYSISVRQVIEPYTFTSESGKKYKLRKGDEVNLLSSVIHQNPLVYENPQEFQHDRYVSHAKFFYEDKVVRMPLLPFGNGSSYCPGRHFARNEIKLCVALILTFFDFKLVDRNQPLPKQNLERFGAGIVPPIGDIECMYKLKDQFCNKH